jgi:uncharacterized protein YdhG (YjbR/CyaY superfamily)
MKRAATSRKKHMADPIDQYFQSLKNPAHHDDLQKLRAFIREQLPQAEERITYGMPTYVQGEHAIAALASQRRYMSLYLDTELVEKHRAELAPLDCGKGCVRFTRLEKLPLEVVGTILRETIERGPRSDAP